MRGSVRGLVGHERSELPPGRIALRGTLIGMSELVVTSHPAWRALTWLIFLATAASLLWGIGLWAATDFAIPPVTFYRSTWIVVLEWILIVAPGAMGLLLGLRLPATGLRCCWEPSGC